MCPAPLRAHLWQGGGCGLGGSSGALEGGTSTLSPPCGPLAGAAVLYSELVWLPLLLLTRLSVCPGVRVQVVPESLSIHYHMYIYKSVPHACSIHYEVSCGLKPAL